MPDLELRVRWEPRDLWVGVFWDRDRLPFGGWILDVYLCVVPTLPLHVRWRRMGA